MNGLARLGLGYLINKQVKNKSKLSYYIDIRIKSGWVILIQVKDKSDTIYTSSYINPLGTRVKSITRQFFDRYMIHLTKDTPHYKFFH